MMKRELLYSAMAIVAIWSTPTAAQVQCPSSTTQSEMTYCAEQAYQRADHVLNDQWRLTVRTMQDRDRLTRAYGNRDQRPGYHATLLAAQRAWIAYRDTSCTVEGYGARGGSLEPMLIAQCRAALTEARTVWLEQVMNGLGG